MLNFPNQLKHRILLWDGWKADCVCPVWFHRVSLDSSVAYCCLIYFKEIKSAS